MPSSISPGDAGEALRRSLTHSTTEPFDVEDGDWLTWLLKEECQLVVALASALQWAGEMDTDISNGTRLHLAVKLLRDVEFEFAGIEVTEAGEVFPLQIRAIEPENLNWVLLFAQCLPSDPRARLLMLEWVSYEAAAWYAQEAGRLVPMLLKYETLLYDFHVKVQKDREESRKLEPPPEARKRVQEAMRERVN